MVPVSKIACNFMIFSSLSLCASVGTANPRPRRGPLSLEELCRRRWEIMSGFLARLTARTLLTITLHSLPGGGPWSLIVETIRKAIVPRRAEHVEQFMSNHAIRATLLFQRKVVNIPAEQAAANPLATDKNMRFAICGSSEASPEGQPSLDTLLNGRVVSPPLTAAKLCVAGLLRVMPTINGRRMGVACACPR
jgi:hypothetical protein